MLTVSDGESTLTLTDVMIGDVYLAADRATWNGRWSNPKAAPELIKTFDQPLIRYVNFPHNAWLDERAFALEREMRWKPLKPGECGDISAVACHFALHLQPELNVPVGIIGCNWGGTSVVCWMDEEALRQTTAGARLMDEYALQVKDKSDAQYEAEMKAYNETYQAWWKARAAGAER